MKLIVKNYEGIRKLDEEIKFGITQISGETNVGKSSLIRAIWDFANNSATENELSIFADKEKMLIQVDEDYFERDKKNKKYFIDGIENNKPGAGKDKININIDKANFQMQQEPLFLVGETPGSKYEYIIGKKYDTYIDAITVLNKEVSAIKKEHSFHSKEVDKKYDELEEIEKALEDLGNVNFTERKNKILQTVGELTLIEKYKAIHFKKMEVEKRIKPLISEEIIKGLGEKKETIKKISYYKDIKNKKNLIKIMPIVDEKKIIEKYRVIFNIQRLKTIETKKETIKAMPLINTEKLTKILEELKKTIKYKKNEGFKNSISAHPVIEIDGFVKKLREYKKIQEKKEASKKTEWLIYTTKENIEKNKKEIIEKEKELAELRGNIKICTLCGTNLKGGNHGQD